MAMDAPDGFSLPAAGDAAQWSFIQCGTVASTPGIYSYMTFSSAAMTSSVSGYGGSFSGREYNVIDGRKSGKELRGLPTLLWPMGLVTTKYTSTTRTGLGSDNVQPAYDGSR